MILALLLLATPPAPAPEATLPLLLQAFMEAEGHPPRSCAQWHQSPALFMLPDDPAARTPLSCTDLGQDPEEGEGAGEGRFGLMRDREGLRLYGPEGLVAEAPVAEGSEPLALGAVFARFVGRLESLWLEAGGDPPTWADLRRFGGDLLLRDTRHDLWEGNLGDHTLAGGISLALQRLAARRSGWVVDVAGGWVWQTSVVDGLGRLVPHPLRHP